MIGNFCRLTASSDTSSCGIGGRQKLCYLKTSFCVDWDNSPVIKARFLVARGSSKV